MAVQAYWCGWPCCVCTSRFWKSEALVCINWQESLATLLVVLLHVTRAGDRGSDGLGA